jgi:hypothetical protein
MLVTNVTTTRRKSFKSRIGPALGLFRYATRPTEVGR